jgi:hypothetical protein
VLFATVAEGAQWANHTFASRSLPVALPPQRARDEEIERKLREEKAAMLRGERPGAPAAPPAAAAAASSGSGGGRFVPSFKRGSGSAAPAAAAADRDAGWKRDEPPRREEVPRPAGALARGGGLLKKFVGSMYLCLQGLGRMVLKDCLQRCTLL